MKLLAVESLFKRREKLCLKFAKKCLKTYKKSAIPSMLRLLNVEDMRMK